MKTLTGLALAVGFVLGASNGAAQPFNGYVRFDGGSAYLAAASSDAAQPAGALTFEAWIRITGPVPASDGQTCRSLLGKSYPTSYWVGYCGGLAAPVLRSYTSGSSSFFDAGALPIGTWTHIAVTSDGTTRKHYLNGVLVGSRATDVAPTSSAVPLQIGSDANWPYRPYAEMDELRIWSVARTQAQIAGAMNAPITTAQPGLLSVFPFEGSGEDILGDADTAPAGGAVTFLGTPSYTRTFFVPVVLKNQYSSEITFTNRGSSLATVTLAYTATSGGGTGTAASFTLNAGHQLTSPDAMDLLRSLGLSLAGSGTLLGTVRVTFSGLSSTDAAAVTVRTGTDTTNPVGRAGLAYSGVPIEKTFTSPVALAGLGFGAATVRTNLAIQNAGTASDGDVTLRVTIYDGATGGVYGVLPDTTLPPGGFHQFSSSDMALIEDFFGNARVERVSASGRFYAYAVLNDQTNSDGSFVPPVDPASATGEALTVPSIVESGSYTTELFVTNTGGTRRSMVATLFCTGCPSTAKYGFSLEPHASVLVPDVAAQLHAFFPSLPSPLGVGVFTVSKVSSDEDVHDVVAMARTSSTVGDQGSFGVAYPGLRAAQGATTTAWISAMQQNATNRSNLAFVNLGNVDANPIALHLEIWDGDTGARVTSFDDPRLGAIPAHGFVQINAFLTALAPGYSNAYVRVTRTSGANSWVAYGVVNDGGAPGERTGDGAYVAMDVP